MPTCATIEVNNFELVHSLGMRRRKSNDYVDKIAIS